MILWSVLSLSSEFYFVLAFSFRFCVCWSTFVYPPLSPESQSQRSSSIPGQNRLHSKPPRRNRSVEVSAETEKGQNHRFRWKNIQRALQGRRWLAERLQVNERSLTRVRKTKPNCCLCNSSLFVYIPTQIPGIQRHRKQMFAKESFDAPERALHSDLRRYSSIGKSGARRMDSQPDGAATNYPETPSRNGNWALQSRDRLTRRSLE